MFCCCFASNQANCPIILWSEMAPLGQKSTHPLPSSTHNWQCFDSDEMFTFSLHVWNLYFLHHSSYKISNSCYLFPPFTHLLYLYFCQTTPRIPPKGLTQRTLFFPSTSFLYFWICISVFLDFSISVFARPLKNTSQGPHTKHTFPPVNNICCKHFSQSLKYFSS